MRDLEIRGAGNLLGSQQHGHIVGIGFAAYCEMLEQTINRLKNGKVAVLQIVDGPLAGLLARAVIVLDKDHKVIFSDMYNV